MFRGLTLVVVAAAFATATACGGSVATSGGQHATEEVAMTVATDGTTSTTTITMTMPDVLGLRLDNALRDIKRSGIEEKVEIKSSGMLGVIDESNWTVCDQLPAPGEEVSGAPRLTVDRTCDDGSSSGSTLTPTTGPVPEQITTIDPTLTYAGPAYEVVTVDKGAGLSVLDQYWVYTEPLDYSTDAYKDQLKLLIADVARLAGTNKVMVEVVTDKEIAEAEANSTLEAFVAEYGDEYFLKVIPEKEKAGWVASYTGGIDYDSGKLSDSDTAFEIIWFGYSDNPTIEKWKP